VAQAEDYPGLEDDGNENSGSLRARISPATGDISARYSVSAALRPESHGSFVARRDSEVRLQPAAGRQLAAELDLAPPLR